MNPKEKLATSPIEGIIYVVKNQEKYLAAKRIKPGSNFYGKYLFPGGTIEDFDKNPTDAVVREIKEERGIDVHNCRFLGEIEYPHPNGQQVKQHVFLVERDDYEGEMGNIEPEKEELCWLTIKEMKEKCTTGSGTETIKLLKENNIFQE